MIFWGQSDESYFNGAYHDTDHYGILASEWGGAERVLSESQ